MFAVGYLKYIFILFCCKGTTLLHLLRSEFNLTRASDAVTVKNLVVKNINKGDGEDIFSLKYDDTLKNICCWRCSDEINNVDAGTLEALHSVEMSDFGVSAGINDGDATTKINKHAMNAIYVAPNSPTASAENDTNYELEPEYLKKSTLPMVSISAADANDKHYDPLSDPKNIKKQYKKQRKKNGPRHKSQQFSHVSEVIVNENPNAIDELRRDYHD